MSLFELLYIGHSVGNNRRGFRLPLLLGRLHLGLIFSGPCSSSSGRKSCSEKCTLRSFLFIATVLITKCGSSAFPNRGIITHNKTSLDGSPLILSSPSTSSVTSSQEDNMIPFPLSKYLRNTNHPTTSKLDSDHQDYPMQHLITMQAKGDSHHHQTTIINGHYIGDYNSQAENVKTLGYVLKGMILPMLISLTLSFGFVIYKNRVKRARLQAIQNALEAARLNPNQLLHPQHTGSGSLVSNALLSVLDARGEWSLISGGEGGSFMLENDDYVGEGGETARHKPYLHDKPPDYASVFDPPSYEQATASASSSSPTSDSSSLKRKGIVPSVSVVESESEQVLPPPFSMSFSLDPYEDSDAEEEHDCENEARHLIGAAGVVTSLFD